MRVVTIVALLALLGLASACYPPNQRGYRDSMARCYCMCNGAIKMGITVTTVTYFPYGQFSSGGCGCCPGTPAMRNDATGEMVATPFTAEEIGNSTVTHVHMSLEQQKNVIAQNAAVSGPFTVEKCMGSSGSGYRGSYDDCVRMCKGYANQFIGGNFRVGYFPSGQFSSGGCSCCGQVDPCFA